MPYWVHATSQIAARWILRLGQERGQPPRAAISDPFHHTTTMLNFKPSRGGSWLSIPRDCGSASRGLSGAGLANGGDGFRVVCLLSPSEKELHV